jgi:hypothetical protein
MSTENIHARTWREEPKGRANEIFITWTGKLGQNKQ